MRLISFCIVFLSFQAAYGQKQERAERDSLYYLMPDQTFDSLASTNRFVHPSGLSMRYPYNWTRDNRGSNEELLVFIRKADPKRSFVFREILTLTSEKQIDSSLVLSDFVATQESMNISTWEQYETTYTIVRTTYMEVGDFPMAVQLVNIGKLDQQRLVFMFLYKQTGYIIEYTATTDTFDFFLPELWNSVHSIAFIER